MENEIKYYKMLSFNDKPVLFPKIKEFGKDYFIMQKIEGAPHGKLIIIRLFNSNI